MTERHEFQIRYGMAIFRAEPVRIEFTPPLPPSIWPAVRAGIAITGVLAVCVVAVLIHLPPALGFLLGWVAGMLAVAWVRSR